MEEIIWCRVDTRTWRSIAGWVYGLSDGWYHSDISGDDHVYGPFKDKVKAMRNCVAVYDKANAGEEA